MRTLTGILPGALMLLVASGAWAQGGAMEPHLGYLYPAGGQQGTVVRVMAGGQVLRGASAIHVSGGGVHAVILRHYPPVFTIDPEQRAELEQRFQAAFQARMGELPGVGPLLGRRRDRAVALGTSRRPGGAGADGDALHAVEPFEHPLLYDLQDKSLWELQHALTLLRFPRWKRQPNLQIAETVLIDVTIDPGAEAGDRELRVQTPLGLSNPMVFQVGTLPEVTELEPNDPDIVQGPRNLRLVGLPPPPPAEPPVVLNGQIWPGDADRFRFRAARGQRLAIETSARRLVPYLADAVPGWFQATLALYDSAGNELAFADDYRFDPDPVVLFEVPESGTYELEIRDAIDRGREDFVYRVAVSERPFVTRAYPLGGRAGVATTAEVAGWNLPQARLALDTRPGSEQVRRVVLADGAMISNPVVYAVDDLPEAAEVEPNDGPGDAQRVRLPLIVDGRIARPGDVDVFRFQARAGDELVAEVAARRLGSPIDSLLRLMDGEGRVLEWNDDFDDPASGLLTHHADSRLQVRLPATGTYLVQVSEAEGHGGDAFSYRLHLAPPRPDFALRVTPSSINLPARGAAPVTVHVLRRDGFDGAIDLVLKDAPPGLSVQGAHVPAGCDTVRMTLSAGWQPLPRPAVITIEGRAAVDGREVSHPAVPADDLMQAFAYRHLVPARELMVASRLRPPGLPAVLTGRTPLRIAAGGTATLRAQLPRHPGLREISWELLDPPAGVTLREASLGPAGVSLEVGADAATAGAAGNLIVEAFVEVDTQGRGAGLLGRTRRVSLGVLPAIPFEIVGQ